MVVEVAPTGDLLRSKEHEGYGYASRLDLRYVLSPTRSPLARLVDI